MLSITTRSPLAAPTLQAFTHMKTFPVSSSTGARAAVFNTPRVHSPLLSVALTEGRSEGFPFPVLGTPEGTGTTMRMSTKAGDKRLASRRLRARFEVQCVEPGVELGDEWNSCRERAPTPYPEKWRVEYIEDGYEGEFDPKKEWKASRGRACTPYATTRRGSWL